MLIEGCKHELEITVPTEEINRETERVVAELQKKVRLPGFRPGKTPASIIRSRFPGEVRQDVLESLVPKYFNTKVKEEELQVVGTPSIKEVHFHEGEPLRFKAEFEVAPTVDVKDYRGVPVHYHEPEVTAEDVAARLEEIRESKAQFLNIDPRPAQDNDYAVVELQSLGGLAEPIHQNDMTMRVGDPEQLPAFAEALRGLSPGEEREFDVTYPEDYADEKIAGKTVRFRLHLKMLRQKELPELNDEFAKDLGDFQTLDQLKETLKTQIFREKEVEAQQKAKQEIVEALVKSHDFAVPAAYVEHQVDAEAELTIRRITGKPVDLEQFKKNVDWSKFSEPLRPKALQDVKANLLIDKVADVESIHATNEEVDREVQRIARQEREPVAAMRKKLEKNGVIGRIAYQIRHHKTLSFLFEHARKEA
ncbi:MAG: trigger factor [Acidobacteriaceae bacterium]|nr:trigger factor [Acidobacteriaceae bacterium]